MNIKLTPSIMHKGKNYFFDEIFLRSDDGINEGKAYLHKITYDSQFCTVSGCGSYMVVMVEDDYLSPDVIPIEGMTTLDEFLDEIKVSALEMVESMWHVHIEEPTY